MRIIFLDIDGVINNTDWMEDLYKMGKKLTGGNGSKKSFYGEMLNPEMIENLNYLVRTTEAKVVISSTWRHGMEVKDIQEMFAEKGFKGEIIDFTPCLRGQDCLRGNEILRWVKDNEQLLGVRSYSNFNEYVILDDDSDMLYWQKDNFICVDGGPGLTSTVAYRAKRLLLSMRNITDD